MRRSCGAAAQAAGRVDPVRGGVHATPGRAQPPRVEDASQSRAGGYVSEPVHEQHCQTHTTLSLRTIISPTTNSEAAQVTQRVARGNADAANIPVPDGVANLYTTSRDTLNRPRVATRSDQEYAADAEAMKWVGCIG